jgi:chromosome segregation ATPase
MSDAVQSAADTLAGLEAKKAQAAERSRNLAEERRKLAFRAHNGSVEARKRLDAINREMGEVTSEIESIGDAIDEARRHLAAAQREAETAGDRAKAKDAIVAAGELEKLAQAYDVAQIELLRAHVAYLEKADGLYRASVPGAQQPRNAQVALGLAFATVWSVPLRRIVQMDMVPPGQRTTLAKAVAGTVAAIKSQARRVLGESKESRAA